MKEQSQALTLLREWYDHARKLPRELLPPEAVALLDKTEKFISHEDGGESHGQRRG